MAFVGHSRALNGTNIQPIDLTGEEGDEDFAIPDAKRARRTMNAHSAGLPVSMPQLSSAADHLLAHDMSNQSNGPYISRLSQPLQLNERWQSQPTPQAYSGRAWSTQPTSLELQKQVLALSRGVTRPYNHNNAQTPFSQLAPIQPHSSQTLTPSRTFIDLTNDNIVLPDPSRPNMPKSLPVLDESIGPRVPILIGHLSVTALILTPIPYLSQQSGRHTVTPNGQVIPIAAADYATVKLRLDTTGKPDILIYTPGSSRHGVNVAPENFGVLEAKVAAILQPMLKQNIIKLEAKIRRVQSTSMATIVPLSVLVFTPRGNVTHVSEAFKMHKLILEPPNPCWMPQLTGIELIYHNPHDSLSAFERASQTSSSQQRWSQPTVQMTNVEIQRSGADAVFQSLRSEEDLTETDPGDNISTPLYPHQKKALTFLLEREKETIPPSGKQASLWQPQHNGSWLNALTQEVVHGPSPEPKGALLADDMGLGKSLETLCLIAWTLENAKHFRSQPLELPDPPEQDSDPTAVQFAGSAWGMPTKINVSKNKRVSHEKVAEQHSRLSKLKEKSGATLIVCPLSTIVGWEDQIREHWGGDVSVVGGVGTVISSSSLNSGTVTESSSVSGEQPDSTPPMSTVSNTLKLPLKRGTPIRVYVYHGAYRCPDPSFLANFDIVLTTYSTLSTEYSKQCRAANTDIEDDDGISSDSAVVEIENGQPVARKKPKGAKRKKPLQIGECFSPLQAIHWFRVVLDEAHYIKEPSTVASRACCDLISDRRLCLTGTPVQNKLDDVYALIRFLRVRPFEDRATWTQFVGNPVKFNQPQGILHLQTIMKLIALRRTKDTKGVDGKSILSLPPRTDQMVLLTLQPSEREIYDAYFNESHDEFVKMERTDLMRNYVNILQKILRLRQICDDIQLIKHLSDGTGSDCAAQYESAISAIATDGINLERATAIFALLRETSTAQCAECNAELATSAVDGPTEAGMDGEEMANKKGKKQKPAITRANSPCPYLHPIVTRCTHLFCVYCFREKVAPDWPRVAPDAQAPCPSCHMMLNPAVDVVAVRSDGPEAKKKEASTNTRKVKRVRGAPVVNHKPSTKILALLQDLLPFSKRNPYSTNYDPSTMIDFPTLDSRGELDIVKSVVFSQWTSMLDNIEEALEVAGIHYERLDGTMKREDRTKAMEALKHDPKCEVLLVSLKAGGVGLTLTSARRVYLMDPYWNPAVENQAVDRIHRLGQTKPVVAIKFIIEGSIEQRLLEVQKKKADLANLTLGKPLSKHELQQRRIEELESLLG